METTELELQASDSERALIGAVAFHADAVAGVLEQLPGADFYDLVRGTVWDTCRALSAEREPITGVTVARRMAAANQWSTRAQTIVQTEMSSASPAAHATRHAETVADLARRRELMQALKRAHSVIANHPGEASDILAAVRAQLDGLGETEERDGGTLTWGQMLEEFEAAHTGNAAPGIPTPWASLNELIGGLYGGRLYTVGGSPGDGKSTAALNMAVHAAELGHQTLVFSAEMPTLDVFGRIVGNGAEVDLRAINQRKLDGLQMGKIRDYAKRSNEPPLRVNADNVSIGGIKTIARAHHHRRGLDVLVVDYLQLISSDTPGRSQEEEIGKISTALKRLSRELDCAVVVPAQLNRNPSARADQKPTKADLRGSGKIEQDSDVVILLWHQLINGQPTGDVTFIVDKNRHGPRGEISLRWHGGYGAIG